MVLTTSLSESRRNGGSWGAPGPRQRPQRVPTRTRPPYANLDLTPPNDTRRGDQGGAGGQGGEVSRSTATATVHIYATIDTVPREPPRSRVGVCATAHAATEHC